MTQTDTESTVKNVLSWASVAYGFGFFTVTLHTARLGLPVLELIQPVYVWIGLPLAGVAFFSRRLLQHLLARSAALASDFRSSLAVLSGEVESAEINIVSEMLGAMSVLAPTRLILLPLVHWFVHKFREPGLMRTEEKPYSRRVRLLHRLAALARIFATIQGLVNLASYVLVLLLALVLYVWVLYPKIPQGIGGGKPTSVRLIVEKDAVPPEFIGQVKTGQLIVGPLDTKTVVIPATLLYSTKDFLFVDLRSGTRLSIKSGAVCAVEWNPRNAF
jgi:hypothetical protein